jgi:moderate conductance mechanosensitive channel
MNGAGALHALAALLQQAPPEEVSRIALWVRSLPPGARVAAIIGLALAGHALVRVIRKVGEWIVTPAESPALTRELIARRKPKFATVTGLVVSAATFVIYFVAVGFALRELTTITLGQYFASATVIGLAVGFGTQGLVQDVVTGLTLIFSNVLDIGDLIEVSGQTGRVEKIGLRFTTLNNFMGQTVVIPNRNIGVIGRFRTGYARAFVDVQIPAGVDATEVSATIERIARGFRAQHGAVIVGDPRLHAVQQTGEDGWAFLRTRFRIWPGQQALVEGALRQRIIAAMRERDPSFADWMVTVTYRAQ